MTLRRAVGHVVAIALACLWTFASQAHLTTRLTPDMAAAVDKTYKGMHKAYKPSGLSDEQVR